ncbi:glycosyl transferase group 1 [[Leptolyngbya] sp. PCC 7376]|uniref:glycosyltransferase family 4 protein n=1 Tax=[Leptolyngbya] sp. PCC 7376 TaxID=111781 RepID=UPI00029F4BD7|nr:glycosyltransferase family 4 protein [[Leptolyngbya] sp. PCC 7376]AFY37236.1 glycosyl transferase group 1 [[Leptolyngbya] sp. PCC 7376]
MKSEIQWFCCQLGAREHYSIPRSLEQAGQLGALFTDAWVKPDSLLNKLPINSLKSLGDRHHSALSQSSIYSATNQLILFEAQQRLLKTSAWPRMIARNDWYQRQIIRKLKQISSQYSTSKIVVFSYSYAALEIFKYAKSQGWMTVLGQIDPGIEEEKIVIAEAQKYTDLAPDWQPVSSEYWDNWRQECELSDYILVNSEWSRQLLVQGDVMPAKIKTVPLVYKMPSNAQNFQRQYPDTFTGDHPMRVLFLGLVTLRKGIRACLEAITSLIEDDTIEFWFVGNQQIEIPEALRDCRNIHWVGAVPRSETANYYQQADVFLFPTLSDGFGLTQLEAQAWRLPIIASKHCGEVVTDNIDGIVLNDVTGEDIQQALIQLKNSPEQLRTMSQMIQPKPQFSIDSLSQSLQTLIGAD